MSLRISKIAIARILQGCQLVDISNNKQITQIHTTISKMINLVMFMLT